MRDPEFQWIPDETTQAIPVRTRVISVAVFAAVCLALGIVIGRLTAGFPAGAGSEANSVQSAKKSAPGPVVEPPSLALKGDNEPAAQKPASPPNPKAEQRTTSPPVLLLNPGSADKSPAHAREETDGRARPASERSIGAARQENRERHAPDGQRDMLSRPARDYQSLREYMLSR
jgi:hypothetical protein